MRKRQFAIVFLVVSVALLLANVGLIIAFNALEMETSFYNALEVASLSVAFISFLASTFFSFLVFVQTKNQNEINANLLKKDDQYIISNYSFFDIDHEISFFSLDGAEKSLLLRRKSYLLPESGKGGEEITRLVFLPTNSVNMPTYKVLVRSVDLLSPQAELLFSARSETPLDGEYSANILNRGYNCFCADILSDCETLQSAFSQCRCLKLKLDVISVFNVKMSVLFSIYLDGQKNVEDNPDKEKIQDLTTYTIHHSNYVIEEKSILTD